MPNNPLIDKALRGLGFNLPPAEESRPLQEGEQVGSQANLKPWQSKVSDALGGLVGFTKGITGLGEQGPAGATASNAGQVLSAALPFAGAFKGIPGLYSRVEEVASKLPKQFHPNKLASALKSGASQEEIAARQIPSLLEGAGDKLTKEQALAHLSEHPLPELEVQTSPAENYKKYQVPGGENYKETLITNPYNPNNPSLNYYSTHYDEPNIVAHVRSNERNLAPQAGLESAAPSRGKFLEEVQSDWNQQGKDLGYGAEKLPEGFRTKETPALPWSNREGGNTEFRTYDPQGEVAGTGPTPEDAQRRALSDLNFGKVAPTPYREAWPDIALKQQLMEAAQDPNVNWIGHTTGQTQIDRYPGLRNQVTGVEYNPTKGELTVKGPSGPQEYITHRPQDLQRFLGNSLAKRVMAPEAIVAREGYGQAPIHALENLNEQVGGEGMYKFYDEQLPNKLNKILAPFGGSVEPGEIIGSAPELTGITRYPRTKPGEIGDVIGEVLKNNSEHVASVWPREPMAPGAVPNMKGRTDELIQQMKGQSNMQPERVKAWIAKLSPEMKEAILKKGFPIMALMGLAGGAGDLNMTPEQ